MATGMFPATSIEILANVVTVQIGNATASSPIGELHGLLTALQGVKLLLDAQLPPVAQVVPVPMPSAPKGPGARSGSRRAPAVPRTSPIGRSTAQTIPPLTKPPARAARVAAAPETKGKRRSRKRVGDQLVVWMRDNPGWHSSAQLLKAVRDNDMTDADPKRALMIALGKQKDVIFRKDAKDRWKLTDAARAGDDTTKKAAAKSAKPAKGKKKQRAKAGASKSQRRRHLRSRGKSSGSKDDGGADAGDDSRNLLLVKKGQDRYEASMAEGEMDQRAERQARIGRHKRSRWRSVDHLAGKGRENLLGLGAAGGGGRVEGDDEASEDA